MSQREILAKRLRELCAQEKSIADACRKIGINRQQFNRYLAGEALPSEKSLQRIADGFDLSVEDLFHDSGSKTIATPVSLRNAAQMRIAHEWIEGERPTSLPEGMYFTTFGYPKEPETLIRALTIIKHEGNLTVFRRLTGYSEHRKSWWSLYGGNHKGLVLERRQFIYFVALNELGNLEPSLLTLSWTSSETPMLVGHAQVLAAEGPILTPAVVTACPPAMTKRQGIQSCRAYHIDDPDIEAVVADRIAERGAYIARMLKPFDITGDSDNIG